MIGTGLRSSPERATARRARSAEPSERSERPATEGNDQLPDGANAPRAVRRGAKRAERAPGD